MPPAAEGFATRFVLGPALRAQPDRRLVTLVREGYETAFEEIVRRYGKPLTRYAAAIVGSRGEDVTQDAFSKALLALRRDDAEIELRPWLFRIVRNTALNELRDSPPSPEALAEAIAGGRNPAEELERREELASLMRRLQSLPEPQRAAIVMRELEGLSHEEIAAALGLSGGGARQAIYRARQALRDGLGLLLPLPLVRLLIDHGGEAAIAGAGVGGAAAASGALGGAGAGVALKAGVVTAVLAGSVGTGIALHDRGHSDSGAPATSTASAASPNPAPAASVGTSGSDVSSQGRGRGEPDSGDSEDGERGPDESSNSGPGNQVDSQRGFVSDSSGPGPGLSGSGHRGRHDSGGEGHRRSGNSHSGPGSGEGRSGGGHSGSGRGGGGDNGEHGGSPSAEDDRSGHGSTGSSSGSSDDSGRIDELP